MTHDLDPWDRPADATGHRHPGLDIGPAMDRIVDAVDASLLESSTIVTHLEQVLAVGCTMLGIVPETLPSSVSEMLDHPTWTGEELRIVSMLFAIARERDSLLDQIDALAAASRALQSEFGVGAAG